MNIKDAASYIVEHGEEDIKRIECFIVLTAYLYMKKKGEHLFEDDIYIFNKEETTGFHIPVLRSGPKTFRLSGEKDNIPDVVKDMIDSVIYLFGDMTTNRLLSHILRYKEIFQQIKGLHNEETLLSLPFEMKKKEC